MADTLATPTSVAPATTAAFSNAPLSGPLAGGPSLPAPLPAGFTAPAGAKIDQGNGAYTVPATRLNSNNSADNSGVVSSSAPEVANENNIKQIVGGLSANASSPATPIAGLTAGNIPGSNADGTGPDVSGAQTASDQYMTTLQNYMAQLEQRRAGEVASIQADYGNQETKLGDTQNRETGSTTAMLARSGGYLGASGSGTGVLLTLAQTHANEMANLEQKKQAAIEAAKNAISDSEFQVAEKMATQATNIEKTINDRKQQFFDDTQKVISQQQSAQQFQQTKVQDDLKNLSLLDPTTIPDAKKSEIDQYYGTPGFTDKYLAATSAAAKAKTQSDVLANQKTLLDMLQSIPQGKTITMPDGTQYTGQGKTGDITTFLQVDNAGIGHLITYNKGTGQTSVQSMGPVGKSSSTVDPTLESNYTAMMLQGSKGADGTVVPGLEQTKLKADGTYDPAVYLQWRQNLIDAKEGALVPKMDAKFLSVAADGTSFFNSDSILYLRQHGVMIGKDPIQNPTNPTGNSGSTIPDQNDTSISVGQ